MIYTQDQKQIKNVILSDSWIVRDVYVELLKSHYLNNGISFSNSNKDLSLPVNYFNSLLKLVHHLGYLDKDEIERVLLVVGKLIDYEVDYYSKLDSNNLDDDSDILKQLVLSGFDVYHSVAHNVMVASYLLLLKVLNPNKYTIINKKLETNVITALVHDSVESSNVISENATWNEKVVIDVLDSVYTNGNRKKIINSVLNVIQYTDYGNPENPFFVDFASGSNSVVIHWDRISSEGEMLILADWLGQTVFVKRRSRNLMVGYLYQYWLVELGKDKSDEFPIKNSIFKAVLECLLQMPELFFIDDSMMNDLRDELLYFQDTKRMSIECFSSKVELESMNMVDALNKMSLCL